MASPNLIEKEPEHFMRKPNRIMMWVQNDHEPTTL